MKISYNIFLRKACIDLALAQKPTDRKAELDLALAQKPTDRKAELLSTKASDFFKHPVASDSARFFLHNLH